MMKTIFVKYSNERSEQFAIRTSICAEDSKKKVVKVPCSEKAEIHVKNIYRWFQELGKIYDVQELRINQCRLQEKGVEMEFLEGQTLEEILDRYIEQKEYDKLETCLDQYISILTDAAQEIFYATEEFKKVFGVVPFFDNLRTAHVTDIDMVLNNIIACDGWTLIDYEWTFDFPVPVEYVVYRVLHYYFETTGARNAVLREKNIYERYGMTKEKRAVYAEMEKHFQQYIIQGYEPLRMMYPKLTPGAISVADLAGLYDNHALGNIQIFWSSTKEMCEEKSRHFASEDGFNVKCSMTFPADTSHIRLDPGENPCMVKLCRLRVNGKDVLSGKLTTNGICFENGLLFFERQDPNIFYEDKEIHTLELEWTVTPLAGNVLETVKALNEGYWMQKHQIQEEREKAEALQGVIDNQLEVIREQSQTIKEKQSLIREMENTKVWRMYRKYRQLREQKK